MKKILLPLFLAGFCGLFAQRPCGTEAALQELSLHIPDLANRMEWAEAQAHTAHGDSRSVITIPVVFHVVWNTAQQNITDAQVLSQLDVLNEDFRRVNADTNLTRSVFKPVAEDTRIQFCLAQRDPQGNTTTGITRTQTTVLDFGPDDAVKFDSLGGKTGWDPSQYLNIWICNLNFANGYAYYPGITPEHDGVVLHYAVTGRTGYVLAPYELGRTGTHEVGHWLGLYHTFYDGCAGNSASSCAGAGDRVCDTPSDDTPSYGCPLTENSCLDAPTDHPDMIENYMDYSDDACNNMFSAGQGDRMRGFLSTLRSSLITSTGCIPAGVVVTDIAPVQFSLPLSGLCELQVPISVVVKNGGTGTVTGADYAVFLDGLATSLTGSEPMTLAPGGTHTLSPGTLTVTPGYRTLRVILSNPTPGPDINLGNDTLDYSFYVADPATAPMLFSEGFENPVFPPTHWTTLPADQENDWELNGNVGSSGTSSAMFDNFYAGWDAIGQGYDLVMEGYQPFGYTFDLSFEVAYMDPDHWFYSDSLRVLVSTDCGQSWVEEWKKGGTDLSTSPHDSIFQPWVPDSTEWRMEYVDLTAYMWESYVQVKFQNKSGWGNNLYLDNINLGGEIQREEVSLRSIQIFPNPSAGQFEIWGLEPGTTPVVYDLSGKRVGHTWRETPKGGELGLEGLGAGLFLVEFRQGGTLFHQKLIVQP